MSFDGNKQSLNDHSMALSLKEDVSIRKQSLHAKFNGSAVEFLKEILADNLLAKLSLPTLTDLKFPGVYLQDSTKFKLPHSAKTIYPGYHQAGASLQLIFDVKNSKFNHIGIYPETYNDV